ncbi:Protein of unknown function DUF599 [Cynara cardunculus var. scolymus]|uniref:Uncharacterized protein n=2 Tax=Cynara cardunculus var. scolymus TaxID=59895 RepID=A0A103XIJ7_CYNCS|nr:Protein of unknown function DUF599 [Cynara cardunculus var. scolymus]
MIEGPVLIAFDQSAWLWFIQHPPPYIYKLGRREGTREVYVRREMEFKKYYLDLMMVPLSFMISISYHLWLWHKVRTQPLSTVIGANAHGRRLWVSTIMKDNEKKNILAIQTIRNTIMGSTLMATTSIVLCCGLAAVVSSSYSVKKPLNDTIYGAQGQFMVALKYVTLLVLFLFSFMCHSLSIRFISQVNFLINCPQDSTLTSTYVSELLEKSFTLSMIGNRLFYSALPVMLWIFGPVLVLLCSSTMVPVLYNLDLLFGDSKNGKMREMEFHKSYLDLILIPLSFSISIGYHIWLWHKIRTQPVSTVIGVNAHGRRLWVSTIMKDNEKKNILAVQTIRNTIMGSTLMATTSILLCSGLAAVISSTYSVKKPLNDTIYGAHGEFMVSLKYVTLLVLFLFSFMCHSLSIRFISQVNYLINCSQDSTVVTSTYVSELLEKSSALNAIGNRIFYSALPVVLWIFGPVLVFLCSLTMVPVLYNLDILNGDSKKGRTSDIGNEV